MSNTLASEDCRHNPATNPQKFTDRDAFPRAAFGSLGFLPLVPMAKPKCATPGGAAGRSGGGGRALIVQGRAGGWPIFKPKAVRCARPLKPTASAHRWAWYLHHCDRTVNLASM